MPMKTLEYPKLPFNTVNRYSSRASYALGTIHRIINSSILLNVTFTDPSSEFPASVPLIGQLGSFARPSATEADVLDVYLHSYVSARIVNLARDAEKADEEAAGASSFGPTPTATTTATNKKKQKSNGLPVAVAASHVDGLVLALTPNAHSLNYRSAILFGRATVVTDPTERLYAMELMTDGLVPGRWAATRVPPNGRELASTAVLRVRVAGGSAKIRDGNAHDDRCDLDDEQVLARVWAGVVPVYPTLGEPIAAPYSRPGLPGHVADLVQGGNKVAKDTAMDAATADMKKDGE